MRTCVAHDWVTTVTKLAHVRLMKQFAQVCLLLLEMYQQPRKELVENKEQLFLMGGNANYM